MSQLHSRIPHRTAQPTAFPPLPSMRDRLQAVRAAAEAQRQEQAARDAVPCWELPLPGEPEWMDAVIRIATCGCGPTERCERCD